MNIAALILAAGRSTRFAGDNKLLAPVDGVAMIRRVALAVAQSRVSDILLAVAPDKGDLIEAAGQGRWRPVVVHDADRGISASLRAGVAALATHVDGVAVVLADMPDVSAALIDRTLAGFEAGCGNAIAFPQDSSGRQGHPVVWPKSLFAELQSLTGDTGGKALLDRYSYLCHPVSTDDPGAFFDVDREQDLEGRARG